MMHRLFAVPLRLFSSEHRLCTAPPSSSVDGLEAKLPSREHLEAALPPSLVSGLKPGVARPTGWPAVPHYKALPYLVSLASSDRVAALRDLIAWRPERYPRHEVVALLRALMPEAPDPRSEPACWLRAQLSARSSTAAWVAGALPTASASVLGLLLHGEAAANPAPQGQANPLQRSLERAALRVDRPLVAALLRTPVSASVACAWARTLCSSGHAGSIADFIAQAPRSAWGEHCASMAAALPAYTRHLLGPSTFEKLQQRWGVPESPAPEVGCDLLRLLVKDGPGSAAAADALLLSPPRFGDASDYERWAAMVQATGLYHRSGTTARANDLRLKLVHGKPLRVHNAAVLQALLRMLTPEQISRLDPCALALNNLRDQDVETVLELASTLRAHLPAAFTRLTSSLHRDGLLAKACSPAQKAALEALMLHDMAAHRDQDLQVWSANIINPAPRLGRILGQLASVCRLNAPDWAEPMARFEQLCGAVETPAAMRAALVPLLQAMLTNATPAEAAARAKATLRTLASPLATAQDLAQLQGLPPTFLGFLQGAPLPAECTSEVLRGLSPLVRDWLLMAVQARLQHAAPTAEHRAFVEGCAAHRDAQRIDEGLDWLELAERMQAPLLPWLKVLPDPQQLRGTPMHGRWLQRWAAVVSRSGGQAAQHVGRCHNWAHDVYRNSDLATLLTWEAWVAEHLPEAFTSHRALVFRRADLLPSPAQQEALSAMLRRLPLVALEAHLHTPRHAWSLAPVAIRQWAARYWLQRGNDAPDAGLPPDMALVSDCINMRSPRAPAREQRLLTDGEALVREGGWEALLAAQGDPPWLRAVLQSETPCSGAAAHSQQNRLAALGRFLHLCRALHIPAAERDAVGGLVKQLLALPDVQARHRLLCRLCAALLPGPQTTTRAAIVALQQPPCPTKGMVLHLAALLYLPAQVAAVPAVQALLGTRSVYGDGHVTRQLLHLIMDEAQPTYAGEVLGWANRNNLTAMTEALRAGATPELQGLLRSVEQALRKSPELDASFYKQTCVRTFLNAHVLPLQRELMTCAELVHTQQLDVNTLTSPAHIHARSAAVLGIAPEVFEQLYRSEPTLRYALGFHSSQGDWDRYKGHAHGRQVLRDLVQACADGTLDAYRRKSPQVQALLQLRGGEALMAAWEKAPPPEALTAAGTQRANTAWTVEDIGHPTRLLACHTDINSCQSNNSHYKLNHGMLGRMACGSKRAVVLRDERGKPRARAMLRIMLSEHQQPVLLLSVVYASGGCLEHDAQTVFRAYAARRARAMGITAVQNGACADTAHKMRLTSMGALPDYWDEANGNQHALDRECWVRQLA